MYKSFVIFLFYIERKIEKMEHLSLSNVLLNYKTCVTVTLMRFFEKLPIQLRIRLLLYLGDFFLSSSQSQGTHPRLVGATTN